MNDIPTLDLDLNHPTIYCVCASAAVAGGGGGARSAGTYGVVRPRLTA